MAFYIAIPSHSHESIPIPSLSHFQSCDYSNSHPISMELFPFPCSGMKYYELTINLCDKPSAIPELCRFCFILSCSVSKIHYRRNGINMCHRCLVSAQYCVSRILLYSIINYQSGWRESIPMEIGVIPILVDSHSNVLFTSCPMGLPWDSYSHWYSQSHTHL